MEKRGRPFEAGNKFGRGRPRGSRNKKSLEAQRLLNSHAGAVVQKGLLQAMKGDGPLLRFFLSHILGPPKEAPVKAGCLPVRTLEELAQSSETIFRKVGAGELTIQEAQQLFELFEGRRRVFETVDLESRLRAVEGSVENRREN